MKIMDTLGRFIEESNRIEGIVREATEEEVTRYKRFLALPELDIQSMVDFVRETANAPLRDARHLDVQVGDHVPQRGGPEIRQSLGGILYSATEDVKRPRDACLIHLRHIEYETLHPFMDGNGRSGRALWLWMHVHHPYGDRHALSRGFLHTWYYESLRYSRR